VAVRPDYARLTTIWAASLKTLAAWMRRWRGWRAALRSSRTYPQARFGQALAQLRSGDFCDGLRNYVIPLAIGPITTRPGAYYAPLLAGEKLDTAAAGVGRAGIGDESSLRG